MEETLNTPHFENPDDQPKENADTKLLVANGSAPDDLALRSNDIQEILDRMPHWLIRWGLFLSLVTLLLALVTAYLIRYPDMVTVAVTISDPVPAHPVVAETEGSIRHVLVQNGALVPTGAPLLLLADSAQYEAVTRWKAACDTFNFTGKAFPFYRFQLPMPGNLDRLMLAFYQAQQRDSVSEVEAFSQLHRALQRWLNRVVVRSPAKGYVRYSRWPMQGEAVKPGNMLAHIQSGAVSLLLAQGKISGRQDGDVKPGQEVLVSLADYPADKYGQIKGIVLSASAFPDASGKLDLQIALPEGLKTTTGVKAMLQPSMQANAEVVTGDQRLIQRLFHHFNHLF